MPEHGYTISSPCEPEGSGELKCNKNTIKLQFSTRERTRGPDTFHDSALTNEHHKQIVSQVVLVDI